MGNYDPRFSLGTPEQTTHNKRLRQIFFLLIAFNLLPGSGTYTVNLIMLFLSVRRLRSVERQMSDD